MGSIAARAGTWLCWADAPSRFEHRRTPQRGSAPAHARTTKGRPREGGRVTTGTRGGEEPAQERRRVDLRGAGRGPAQRGHRQDAGGLPAAVDAGAREGPRQADDGAARHRREPPGPRPGHQAGRGAPEGVRLLTPPERRRRLVVLAGPTAVGKGTVAADIREHQPEGWI